MRICLINMPWAKLNLPSIGITQLKGVLEDRFQDRVTTELHYLNLDIARYIGTINYTFIGEDFLAKLCNYGEWFFRHVAFPEAPDNKDAYFDHFGLHLNSPPTPDWAPFTRKLRFFAAALESKRKGLEQFLDQLIIKYRLHEADLIGFTSLFNQNLPILALARRIKLINPDVPIIMGGANCESPMGEELIRQFEDIDYVFSGKALQSFPDFVAAMVAEDRAAMEEIDGVFCKGNLAQIGYSPVSPGIHSRKKVHTHGRESISNEMVPLDYEGYLDALGEVLEELGLSPFLLYETSRGCWWGEKAHCTFCGLNGESMTFRSLENGQTLQFLKDFFAQYYPRVKDFSATDNIMPKSILESVYAHLDLPEDLSIFYEVKSDLSLGELVEMKRSRINRIQPGIESFDSRTLKQMRKGTTGTANINLLRQSHETGITCYWNILIGFPGESGSAYQKYLESIPSLYHLAPPEGAFWVRFDRYSPYFTDQEGFGIALKPMDFYRFLYPDMEEAALYNIAYFFDDATPDAEYKQFVREYAAPMDQLIQAWKAKHSHQAGNLFPELYFQPCETLIYDSRGDEVVEHQITPLQKQMLETLSKAQSLGKLKSHFDTGPSSTFDQELEDLIEKGLVFHENRRSFVSLVCHKQEPDPSLSDWLKSPLFFF